MDSRPRDALQAVRPAFDLVVMVASAGGLAALSTIVGSLPAGFPAAIVIVHHRAEANPSLLGEILSRRTALRVREATVGESPEAGVVYIAPAGLHLSIAADRSFAFSDRHLIQRVLSSADPLFESAAAVYGERLIAVVLTGYGQDGADGIRAVGQASGTVLVQDEATSQAFAMPAAALATGEVDAVLPVSAIGPALIALVGGDGSSNRFA
jgi:two-component system chemotaxis response regulator CheB